ncbi:hypothetical protein AB1N83_012053 [Pleurotus pulmonarius]
MLRRPAPRNPARSRIKSMVGHSRGRNLRDFVVTMISARFQSGSSKCQPFRCSFEEYPIKQRRLTGSDRHEIPRQKEAVNPPCCPDTRSVFTISADLRGASSTTQIAVRSGVANVLPDRFCTREGTLASAKPCVLYGEGLIWDVECSALDTTFGLFIETLTPTPTGLRSHPSRAQGERLEGTGAHISDIGRDMYPLQSIKHGYCR